MIKIILLTLVAMITGVTSDIFLGEFECHKYDGTEHKNNWHYVNITFDSEANAYKWKNRAGVVWTLYPKDSHTLRVGEDCPYYKDGHTSAKFTKGGVYGPWNEFYKRKVLGVERCADISCSSWNFKYATCNIPHNHVITKVSLKKQVSQTNCKHPKRKFGVRENKIWVDKGCRGRFTYCYTTKEVTWFGNIRCYSKGYKYKLCPVPRGRKITQVSLKHQVSTTNCKYPRRKFGVAFHDNMIWVDKGCCGVFRYHYEKDHVRDFRAPRNQLAAYWGQNVAGGKGLLPEKNLKFYCDNFTYDIIPIAFLNNFFDGNNKDHLPGLDLSNHCSKTFDGYPDLLQCNTIGKEIKGCQERGKKITLALGGPATHRRFKNATEARSFASTVWNLFLGGMSDVRPFGDIVLDGIDLDIKCGNTLYYVDFIRGIRKLMSADRKRKYIITAAMKGILPDIVMGPRHVGHVLRAIPHEFDQLYVKIFNKYGFAGNRSYFNGIIDSWFKFAENTRESHGKGPSIFVGLPANPRKRSRVKYYIPPNRLRRFMEGIVWNRNFGGVMLWDASFDSNNKIHGKYYSSHISDIIRPEPEIAICFGRPTWLKSFGVKEIVGVLAILLLVLLIFKFSHVRYRARNKVNSFEGDPKKVDTVAGDTKPSSDGNIKV